MFYMDLANYAQSFQTLMSSMGMRLAQMQQQIEMMKTVGALAGSVSYEPEGIRIEAVSDFDLENNSLSYLDFTNFDLTPLSNRIYDSIPASASMAASMNAQGGYWYAMFTSAEYLDAVTAGSPFLSGEEILEKIHGLEQQTGLTLKTDVFDLLNGELAFLLLNNGSQRGVDSTRYPFALNFPFDVALMADASDVNHLSSSVDTLVRTLVEAAPDALTLQPLDSLPATALLDRNNDILLTYGVVDGRLVIGSNPDTLRTIDAGDQNPLSADATFQTAMRVLPGDRQQAGYIALRPFWNWFASLSGNYDQPCPVCNYLQSFKWMSYSGSYTDTESGVSRATFFIGVEKP
jgi:hypothetical protein